jgi:hypothetical protein
MWIVVLIATVYSFTAIGDSAVFSTVSGSGARIHRRRAVDPLGRFSLAR